ASPREYRHDTKVASQRRFGGGARMAGVDEARSERRRGSEVAPRGAARLMVGVGEKRPPTGTIEVRGSNGPKEDDNGKIYRAGRACSKHDDRSVGTEREGFANADRGDQWRGAGGSIARDCRGTARVSRGRDAECVALRNPVAACEGVGRCG